MGMFSFVRRACQPAVSHCKPAKKNSRRALGPFVFEQLEQRSMLTITSMTIDGVGSNPANPIQEPAGNDVFVPIVATDDGSDAITYSVSSSNPNVTVTPVSGDTYLQLNVNGTDSSGNPYSGTLTFKLFDSLTPNTVSTIENLVNSGTYTNTTFARVLNSLGDILIAQGGFTSTGSSPTATANFGDEFNEKLTFDSPGLLALANEGVPDTNESQFFVTGVDEPGTTTPLTQADLAPTRSLDYRYTIFGQLVDGVSTFNSIMNSTLVANSNSNGPDGTTPDTPSPLVNVTSAAIVTNNVDTVLDISAPASAAGQSAVITVDATEANGATAEDTFNVSVQTNTVTDPPFLGTINQVYNTTEGTPITITLPTTNPSGDTLTYEVVNPTTGGAPSNVTVSSINTTTGQVTLTPAAGYTGSISLLAGVASTNSGGVQSSTEDTQPFTLTVNAAVAPTAPTNLTATAAGTTSVDLSFTAATGTVTGYNVFRGTTAGGESTTPLNSTPLSSSATSYVDTTAAANTAYFYTVEALDSSAASAASNEATATTLSTTVAAPTAPTNLTATAISSTEIDLAWTAATGTVTGYNVYRGTASGGESTTPLNSTPLSATTTTYQDTGLTAGSTDYYVVQAIGSTSAILSPNSNEASATTASTNSTLSAPTGLTLDASSETGLISTDDYTSQATPVLDATAPAGDTVTFSVNGKTVTATANSSGLATATLAAGDLAVGSNAVTATVSNSSGDQSGSSTPLVVIYAPNYSQVYTVPGAPGSSQTLTVTWTSRQAAFNDEIGVYEVSNATGTVDSIAPGSAGYAKAAIGGTADGGQFAQVVFPSGDEGGETMTLSVTGGEQLGFYMIQNNTTTNFLANNSSNAVTTNANSSQPMAFFTTTAANPDSTQHVQVTSDATTGNVQYAWEDEVNGGDTDYNDVVMTVALASSGQTGTPGTLHVPDTGGGDITLSATLASGTNDTTAPGDVGIYYVDNPAGDIGSLTPSSSGYLAAALASGNYQVLIPSGTAAGAAAQSITVPAGKYIAFYSISSGTTANFLSTNATNGTSTSGLPNAFLSFGPANPSQINHFSFTSPEGVATTPTTTQLHVMDQVMGSSTNFDDLDLDLSFAAGS